MTDLILQRDDEAGDAATFGVLGGAGGPFQTLEDPWIPDPNGGPAGEPNQSCVPPGKYELKLHNSPKHPFTWALHNPVLGVYAEPSLVPEGVVARTDCLLHPGNDREDTEGCVLVGTTRTMAFSEPEILDSVAAFEKLKAALPWVAGHTLTILAAPQGP